MTYKLFWLFKNNLKTRSKKNMENLDSTTKDVFEPESLEMPAEAIKESNEKIAEI